MCFNNFSFFPKGENHGVKNAEQAGILDLYITKHWAIKHAADVVNTVLRVDQVSYSSYAFLQWNGTRLSLLYTHSVPKNILTLYL